MGSTAGKGIFRSETSMQLQTPRLWSPEKSRVIDVSKNGLGAAMFQDDKPIAFASKSLTTAEKNYAQIEKELYATVFGCERFYQYVYGRAVTLFTDHKPLEAIMRKSLAETPPRLQRINLRLQKYEIRVIYKPGKKIPVADALSRKYINERDWKNVRRPTRTHSDQQSSNNRCQAERNERSY